MLLLLLLIRLLTATSVASSSPPRSPAADCAVTAFGARSDDDSVDDTPAFRSALAACRGGTVLVPTGKFRLDSTINVGNASLNPARNKTCNGTICAWCHCPVPPATTRLHLSHGASVRRLANYSAAITPVLRLTQFGCMITGDGGAVESENASPRGVVNIGPTVMPPLTQMVAPGDIYPANNPGVHGSIQFATISGLRITGQYRCLDHIVPHMGACLPAKNFSASIARQCLSQTVPLNPPWSKTSGFEQCGMWPGQTASFGREGSVGLCLDSGEPFDAGQSVTYQNTISDLVITGTDVGLYGSKYTNANNYNNLQFISNGAASYWFEYVDENSIFGGFTGGAFPGNPWPVHGVFDNGNHDPNAPFQVIRAQRSYASIFLGVQAEPGPAQYFFFDNKSVCVIFASALQVPATLPRYRYTSDTSRNLPQSKLGHWQRQLPVRLGVAGPVFSDDVRWLGLGRCQRPRERPRAWRGSQHNLSAQACLW
jgi:hypothetical protein